MKLLKRLFARIKNTQETVDQRRKRWEERESLVTARREVAKRREEMREMRRTGFKPKTGVR